LAIARLAIDRLAVQFKTPGFENKPAFQQEDHYQILVCSFSWLAIERKINRRLIQLYLAEEL